ncbi:MAG: hypothetical protein HYZ13_12670 [Acidobacteria bacterium]|nr:hypothetical protein [Acidobacteriota bacterium]
MNVGAPTLASYAYQLAGGGSQGVLAALAALKTAGSDVAGLIQSAGPGTGVEPALQASQDSGLEVGAFGLQVGAGLGAQALQDLLNPPLGFANPLLSTQGFLSLEAATAFAGYLYAEAQRTGQTGAFTQYALNSALDALLGTPNDLLEPGPASEALRQATLDPKDANEDGIVTPAETLFYALSHPQFVPQDANLDGFVTPAEALAYELRHPGGGALFDALA